MKFTGPIYRPPIEANTPLLQVTVGCAHNNCKFCTMYKEVQFTIENLEQIEKDLKETKHIYGDIKRIFLVNGDAFVLNANRLKNIAKLILKHFPNMETITMFASIRNVIGKTDAELQELYDLKINELWIGLETGKKETLDYMNKGFSLEQSYEQLERLNKARIKHNGIYMLGASGTGKGIESATLSAKLINITKPQLVGVAPLDFGEKVNYLKRLGKENLFQLRN